MQLFRRTGHLCMSMAAKRDRRLTIGGSDAKIIMGDNPDALLHLWQEKRAEIEIEDESGEENVLQRLGYVTEPLNYDLFEYHTGLYVTDEQEKAFRDDFPFMHATLDGKVRRELLGSVIGIMDAKFNLPFNNWSIEKALETHWAQLQHNAFVVDVDRVWLSVIKATGGYALIEAEADPFYQVQLVRAEREFVRCVETGDVPQQAAVAARKLGPKPEPIKVYDMTVSSSANEWAVLAQHIQETLPAAELHAASKDRLKKLVPDDAALASGHSVSIKRSKAGAALFDITGAKAAREQAKVALDGEPTPKPRRSRAKAQPQMAAA